MKDNHFNVLFRFILLSFGLLIGTAALRLGPWPSMAAGVTPMVLYHLVYLFPRARKGLSQPAIDSVYYFGFLVTVAALGISAVAIASRGAATDINTVVYQFGVGLLATGYAVIARMHLSSISPRLDSESPEVILDQYLKRSRELVDNVEMAVGRTAELSVTVMNRTAEVSETARAATEKVLIEMARTFDREMAATLATAREGLSEVRALVADTTFAKEREALVRSVNSTLEAVTTLNKALDEYAVVTRSGSDATRQAIATTAELNTTMRTLQENVETLAGAEGAVAKSAEAIRDASAVIVEGSHAVGAVTHELSEAATAVADTGPTFQKMRTIAKKTHEQMDALTAVAERLDGALARIEQTAHATGRLAIEFDRTASALPKLNTNVEGLTVRLDQASQVSQRLALHLDGLPKPIDALQAATAEVPQALAQVVQAIKDAAAQAEALKADMSAAAEGPNGAAQLIASAKNLHNGIGVIEQLLPKLAAAIEGSHTAITDASGGIKAAVASSAAMLEADARRSAEAVTLLTERLAQVAHMIIEQTQRRQQAVA